MPQRSFQSVQHLLSLNPSIRLRKLLNPSVSMFCEVCYHTRPGCFAEYFSNSPYLYSSPFSVCSVTILLSIYSLGSSLLFLRSPPMGRCVPVCQASSSSPQEAPLSLVTESRLIPSRQSNLHEPNASVHLKLHFF